MGNKNGKNGKDEKIDALGSILQAAEPTSLSTLVGAT
jgi:hypothetical protein